MTNDNFFRSELIIVCSRRGNADPMSLGLIAAFDPEQLVISEGPGKCGLDRQTLLASHRIAFVTYR